MEQYDQVLRQKNLNHRLIGNTLPVLEHYQDGILKMVTDLNTIHKNTIGT